MILTVTMNPSVDISYKVVPFRLDDINRVDQVVKTAGGKGLNVTRVLSQLDKPVIATGIVGGYLGQFIRQKLDEEKISHQFYEIKQESRNSIAILHDAGAQTELLEAGPMVHPEEEKEFLTVYQQLIRKATTVTISGSLAKGLAPTLYNTLIDLANQKNCQVLLDTSGQALEQVIFSKNKPMLIKPNQTEIAQLLNTELDFTDFNQLVQRLQEPIFDGIEWIVVSLGARGALARHNQFFYKVTIPKIEVINPVGSGDATLAGLAAIIDSGGTDEEILKTGMTTGMLNALESKTGQINPNLFASYFKQVVVTKL